MTSQQIQPVAVGGIADRLPFIRKLMDAGIIPPMAKDFTLRFPLGGAVEVTYNCFAPDELLTEDVAAQIAQDVDAVGASITRKPNAEVADAPA